MLPAPGKNELFGRIDLFVGAGEVVDVAVFVVHFEGILSADAQIKAGDDGFVVRRGMEPLGEFPGIGPGTKDAVAGSREGAF